MKNWFLRIRDTGGETREQTIEAEMALGSDAACEVVVADRAASPRHARIVELHGRWRLEDLGSAGGTRVEGGPKLAANQQHDLFPGMVFYVGETAVEIVDPADSTTLPGGGTMTIGVDDALLLGKRPARKEAAPESPASSAPAAPTPAAGPPSAAPAAKPLPEPVVAEPPPSSPSGFGQTMAVLPQGDAMFGGAMLGSALRAFRPRLIVPSGGSTRSYEITTGEYCIGREKHADRQVHCALPHGSLSAAHACIRFDGGSFSIDDLGSTNKTFVDDRALSPDERRTLGPETHIRFGSVDALFVLDVDTENCRPIPRDHYENALQSLVRKGKISRQKANRLKSEALEKQQHVGEALLLARILSVREWVQAFRQAKSISEMKEWGAPPRSRNHHLVLILGGVLLALLVVIAVILALGFL